MYKQIIIARKDLNMSVGKLSAQVSHGSMAFLSNFINDHRNYTEETGYEINGNFDANIMDNWLLGSFTKIVLEAKNKNKLLKVKEYAESLGLKENEDFFLIRDNCLTELIPEDEDGRTLTVIGFKPLPEDLAKEISKHYQLYK